MQVTVLKLLLDGFSSTIPGYSGTIFRGTGDNVENLNRILIPDVHDSDDENLPLSNYRNT